MKTSAIAKEYRINLDNFEEFLTKNNLQYTKSGLSTINVDDDLVKDYVDQYRTWVKTRSKDKVAKKTTVVDTSNHYSEEKTITNGSAETSRIENDRAYVPNPYNAISSLKSNDILFKIASIRRLGLISIICVLLNPIISLICSKLGQNLGKKITDVPQELQASLDEAIELNDTGTILSIVFISIEFIALMILFFLNMSY